MKNLKGVLILVVYIAFAKANTVQAQQDFKAVAHFTFQTKFNVEEGDQIDKLTQVNDNAALDARVKDALKRGSQQEFVMEFTATESSYNEAKKLARPVANGVPRISFRASNGSTATGYKNLQDQKFSRTLRILNKEFLVNGALESYEWKQTGEQKMIGTYNCYKATFKPVLSKEEIKAAEEKKQKDGILSMIPDGDDTVTVWYTPEIPISNGPGVYQGLPGFILAVKEKHTILLCTKLEINPEDLKDIQKPTSGKKISIEEFEALEIKKLGENKSGKSNMSINVTRG